MILCATAFLSSSPCLFTKFNVTVNVLKFRALYSIIFCLNFAFYASDSKILSEVANSVDPDQTAPIGAV